MVAEVWARGLVSREDNDKKKRASTCTMTCYFKAPLNCQLCFYIDHCSTSYVKSTMESKMIYFIILLGP